MEAKRIIIIEITILALVILSLIAYYIILPIIIQSRSPQAGPSFKGGITDAHFEVFPAGTQLQPGMIGTNTSVFNKDDLVSISGNSNVNKQVILTVKIFDNNGEDMGTAWHGDEIKIKAGPFGFGSISIPHTPRTYLLKIYLNDVIAKSLSFQVI